MLVALNPATRAEVVVDGTMGEVGPLAGPDYTIPATAGTQVGGNLFHSFTTFNLLSGESATFSGPTTVATVIARVTGGDPSQVNGPLGCTIPGADLYLLNPAGILFGPQAKLDLSGSFYASTATSLALGETGRVDTVHPEQDLLTMAPPQAFGFVGQGPGGISVDNSQLAVGPGEGITLVGGPMDLVNGTADQPLLQAPGGAVNLVAVAGTGEVELVAGRVNTDAVGQLGELTIVATVDHDVTDVAAVDVGSDLGAGGEITIRGGRFLLSGASLESVHSGPGQGGGIDIEARQALSLADGATIATQTMAQGDGGAIRIITPELTVDSGASVNTATWSQAAGGGQGGAIRIETGQLLVTGAASKDNQLVPSTIASQTHGSGAAGEVTIDAHAVAVTDEGVISSTTDGQGPGGHIEISADTMVVMDHGWLAADSHGPGAAGPLTINAGELAVLFGGRITSDAYATGKAGMMSLTAERIRVMGFLEGDDEVWYSAISSDALGPGDGGEIQLAAKEILVDQGGVIGSMSRNPGSGAGGQIGITTDQLIVRRFAEINASSFGTGAAGDIHIDADSVVVKEVGTIASYANGAGAGGDIEIRTASLGVEGGIVVNGNTLASTVDTSAHGAGQAGAITIDAGVVTLGNQGTITSLTTGSGQGGDIGITTNSLALSGGGMINASAYGSGSAGDITVKAATISLTDKALILSMTAGTGDGGIIHLQAADSLLLHDAALTSASTASASGAGRAGNIRVEAGHLLAMEGGVIATFSENADGGDIVIDPDLIDLQQSEILTSVQGGAGDGGNIRLTGKAVALEQSQIVANAFDGNGGNITITADLLLQDPGTLLSASSALGLQGVIALDAPFFDLGAAMADLPEVFFDADAFLPKGCVEREEEMSWLMVRGRDGLPPSPASLLMGL
jgi:filamentous hemagglutinin family protein